MGEKCSETSIAEVWSPRKVSSSRRETSSVNKEENGCLCINFWSFDRIIDIQLWRNRKHEYQKRTSLRWIHRCVPDVCLYHRIWMFSSGCPRCELGFPSVKERMHWRLVMVVVNAKECRSQKKHLTRNQNAVNLSTLKLCYDIHRRRFETSSTVHILFYRPRCQAQVTLFWISSKFLIHRYCIHLDRYRYHDLLGRCLHVHRYPDWYQPRALRDRLDRCPTPSRCRPCISIISRSPKQVFVCGTFSGSRRNLRYAKTKQLLDESWLVDPASVDFKEIVHWTLASVLLDLCDLATWSLPVAPSRQKSSTTRLPVATIYLWFPSSSNPALIFGLECK